MKEKRKVMVTIIGIALILVVVIGGSYAYFSAVVRDDRESSGESNDSNLGATKIAEATMVSNVPNAAGSFEGLEMFPGHKEVVALSVGATGKKGSASYYQFVYDIEENTLNDNIKTYLYVSDTPIETTENYFQCVRKADVNTETRYYEVCEEKDLGKLLEEARLSGGVEKKILGKDHIQIEIDDETITKYYYVVVEFENKPEDQNEYQNKILKGKIQVEAIPYFYQEIDEEAPVVSFVTKKDGNNVIIDASASTDNKAIKTYYYSKDGENWFSSKESSYTFENTNTIVYGKGTEVLMNISNNDISKIYVKAEDTSGNISEATTLNLDGLLEDETDDHNLRYVGANPNNYIDFGDHYRTDVYYGYNPSKQTYTVYSSLTECQNAPRNNLNCTKMHSSDEPVLWRIIGVMNNVDDGTGKQETRLKVIRIENIYRFMWDTAASNINGGKGINEWTQSEIMRIFNPGFTGVNGSMWWNGTSGTCYIPLGFSGKDNYCNFKSLGFSDEGKQAIDKAVWYTGSNGKNSFSSFPSSHMYQLERSSNTGKICSSSLSDCNDTVARTTTWTGYVGLMNPSDYIHATIGGNAIDRAACLNVDPWNFGRNESKECASNNWLLPRSSMWTMNPAASNQAAYQVMLVSYGGMIYGSSTIDAYYAYPTVYLKAESKIVSGDGSEANPFKLSLE